MSIQPMPSPRGSNKERLFVDIYRATERKGRTELLAYDARRPRRFDESLEEIRRAIPAGGHQTTVDDSDDFAELREHLKNCGLDDASIEEAIEIARQAQEGAADLPPDLANGGRPSPGGSMTPPRGPDRHRRLASDTAAGRADFARRHPALARDVARIKVL
jgi:hypothetical protein